MTVKAYGYKNRLVATNVYKYVYGSRARNTYICTPCVARVKYTIALRNLMYMAMQGKTHKIRTHTNGYET